jgi:hypothetical protein
MALDGLVVLACALVTATPSATESLPSIVQKGDGVANTLAVQLAFQKGRDLLMQGDARGAVEALQAQLPRINGNRPYLTLLRDAYRDYVKELSLTDKPAELRKYQDRLRILESDDPPALPARALAGGTVPARTNTVPPLPRRDGPEDDKAVYRGKSEDPFSPENENKNRSVGREQNNTRPPAAYGAEEQSTLRDSNPRKKQVEKLLEDAAEEFSKRRFDRARLLFEQADRLDPRAAVRGRDQWAYCKLHRVVEQMNRSGQGKVSWSELESEVELALQMSPRLENTGKWILKEIDKRRQGGEGMSARDGGLSRVNVKHLSQNAQGWYIAETENFRIFHNQPRDLVHKVALAAEQTRLAMNRKWFGSAGEAWNPKCSLYLHDDGKQYARSTGVPANSPGHSRIETEGERVVSRRIDVHCDNPTMLKAVLPHETTHVVVAGKFGKGPVPRWADEGMAVLTEPADKIALHLKNLARFQKDGQLFSTRELMQLSDYPQPRRVGVFYAQSVSLVDYLTKKRGAVVFSQFLREALRDGYEPALRKHYQFRDFNDLQQSWSRDVFDKPPSYTAGKKRYGR